MLRTGLQELRELCARSRLKSGLRELSVKDYRDYTCYRGYSIKTVFIQKSR